MQLIIETDFLPEVECRKMRARIDENCAPSTTLPPFVEGFRTSFTAYLNEPGLTARIASLLGCNADLGEAIQGQRYDVGQRFKAHWDAFHDDSQGAQRTWSAMIYLNTVGPGGETYFPNAGIKVEPMQGMLIAWNNLLPDGKIDHNTLHEGKPVLAGRKYILTQWFR